MTKPVLQLLIRGDDFLFQRHFSRLIQDIVDPDLKDFNFDRCSASQMSAEKLISLFETQPWLGSCRTVVVDDIEQYKKEDWDRLTGYIKDPNPSTNLILIGAQIDKRTTFYKTFIQNGELYEFRPPYDNQIPAFLCDEAKRMGLKLEAGGAELLIEVAGTNLMSLVNELEKLKIYIHPKLHVTKGHISELVSSGVLKNIFEITNLIGQRRYFQARTLYLKMLEQGEPVIKIIALIVGHFRRLMFIKDSAANTQLASLIGVPPFFVKEYERQSSRFTKENLIDIYQKLMMLSVQIRSVGPTDATLFETFLQQVCLVNRAA